VLRSPKDDDRDAFDVAARLRFGELPSPTYPVTFGRDCAPDPLPLPPFQGAVAGEDALPVHAFLKCSDWKRVKAFSDIFGATSIALLTEFTVASCRR